MAEQTTTTPVSADFAAAMRRATPRIFSESARELPPYFCTMTAIRDFFSGLCVAVHSLRLSRGSLSIMLPGGHHVRTLRTHFRDLQVSRHPGFVRHVRHLVPDSHLAVDGQRQDCRARS